MLDVRQIKAQKFNKAYFTYSGELVEIKYCCKDFQEKNNMCVGKEIHLCTIIVPISHYVLLRIVIWSTCIMTRNKGNSRNAI